MTPRKKKPAANGKRGDGCALCGEQRLVEATDNQGNAYLGCPRCTIVLEPTLRASPKVKRSDVETIEACVQKADKRCGKPCDHASTCQLLSDHDVSSGHETEHGCIFYDPHWTVKHHLPGGRYGKISLQFDGDSVARMVADDDDKLALAKRIVETLNRRGVR